MPIIVPHEELSDKALLGIIKSFILEEGTDYGQEFSLEDKIAQVTKQLQSGEIFVAFDEKTSSATLITKNKARELVS
jgi:uncharacterized protein YheU (UPF0270 family)